MNDNDTTYDDVQYVPSEDVNGLETEQAGNYSEEDVPGSETESNDFTERLEDNDGDLDVDSLPAGDDEVEDIPATSTETKAEKPKKEKAQPKRGDLPEGFTTPVGLAKIITERGLYTPRDSDKPGELKPQMVYSYAKNAPKDNPFPAVEIQDSLGNTRNAVNIQAGLEWWERKNARAEERRANAAKKAAEKKAKETKAEVEVEESEDESTAVAVEAE